MLGRALFISLAINLVLGAALLVSLLIDGRSEASAQLDGAPPLRLDALGSITIDRPGSPRLSAERTPIGWVGRTGDADRRIALDGDRIIASCRLLRDGLRTAESEGDLRETVKVELSTETGSVTIKLGEPGLGGVSPVRLTMPDREPVAMTASAELYRLWAGGFDGWRPRTVFAGMGENASRLSLGVGETRLVLARRAGRWGIAEPVNAHAVPDAVRAVIASLASMRTVAHADSGARAGLDRPVAELTVEQDARVTSGGEVRVETTRWTLTIGAQADIDGQTRFASIAAARVARTPAGVETVASWGPEIIEIRSEDLRGISTDPALVVSRVAVQEPAADVRSITIAPPGASPSDGGATYRRELGRWRTSDGDAELREAGRDRSAWLDRTLAWLCNKPAEEAVLFVPDGWRDIATVRVGGAEAGAALSVGAIDLPSGVVIGVGDGAVWRVYTGQDAMEIVGWLAAEVG